MRINMSLPASTPLVSLLSTSFSRASLGGARRGGQGTNEVLSSSLSQSIFPTPPTDLLLGLWRYCASTRTAWTSAGEDGFTSSRTTAYLRCGITHLLVASHFKEG